MYYGGVEVIHLADLDPELFDGLPGEDMAKARTVAVAPVERIPAGRCAFDEARFKADAIPGGALVIAGLLSRTVHLGRRSALELVGPGDALRPWVQMGPGSSIAVDVSWRVHDAALLALLDREFVERISPWPQLTAALMDRLILRARRLTVQLAVSAQPSADRRLLLLLWNFADRWGRREAEGIWVPVRLTHEVLAGAVGVTRPTVSTAAARLERTEVVSRGPGGTWLLHGELPRELHRPARPGKRSAS
jgi:CRP-like cAMP-binding protein